MMECEMSAPLCDMGAGASGPPMDTDPSLGKLCELCNSLDFNVLGFHRSTYPTLEGLLPQHWTQLPPPFYCPSIRKIIQYAKDHGCVICGKVAKFFEEWSIQHCAGCDPPDLDRSTAHYFIDALPLKSSEVDLEIDEPIGQIVRFMVQLRISMVNDEEDHSIPSTALLQFQRCSQPPSLQPCDWDCGEEQPYTGRMRPPIVDAHLFRKWKETCFQTHGGLCNSSLHVMAPPDWLRLIDVKERCLVVENLGPNHDNCRFVALSYVWGEGRLDASKKIVMPKLTRGNEDLLKEPNALTRERVLATIDDAMTLVAQLGERYLWVDCLCIMQDDKVDKENFVNAMDSIYGCALLTIAAASGDNANRGLPGMHGDRSNQEVLKVGNDISLMQTLDQEGTKYRDSYMEYKYVGGLAWSTRGWTLQEKIFSRRALIFTKEQVYWECRTATWCEDSFWETKRSPAIHRQCFDANYSLQAWNNEDEAEFKSRYEELVVEYTGRNLTNKTDVLDAFRGILNAFGTGPGKQEFLWGLPLSFLAKALTWSASRDEDWEIDNLHTRNERCPISGDVIGVFPSWSWVGWVGKVEIGLSFHLTGMLDLHFYYLNAANKLVEVQHSHSLSRKSLLDGFPGVQIRKHTDRINVVINDNQVQEALSKSVNSNILFFWSSAAKFQIQVERKTIQISTSLTFRRVITRGDDNNVSLDFNFDISFLPTHDEYELVVIGEPGLMPRDIRERDLGNIPEIYPDMFDKLIVLVCYEKDGILYRMGLVHIEVSEWLKCEPGWKLICLG